MTQIASFWPTRLVSPTSYPSPSPCGGYPLAKHFLSHARTFLCEVSKLNLHQLLDEHLNDAKNVSVRVSLSVCVCVYHKAKQQQGAAAAVTKTTTTRSFCMLLFSACSLLFHILYIARALKGSDKWLEYKLCLQNV